MLCAENINFLTIKELQFAIFFHCKIFQLIVFDAKSLWILFEIYKMGFVLMMAEIRKIHSLLLSTMVFLH